MLLGSCLMTYLEGRRYSHPRLPPTPQAAPQPSLLGENPGGAAKGGSSAPRGGRGRSPAPQLGTERGRDGGTGGAAGGSAWAAAAPGRVPAGAEPGGGSGCAARRARGGTEHGDPPRLCQGGTARVTVARNVAG